MAGGTNVDVYYPYSQSHGSTANSQRWRNLLSALGGYNDAVVPAYANLLVPTLVDATHVSVGTGAMVVQGAWAELTALQTIVITAPGSVVMRINPTTETVSVEWQATTVGPPWLNTATAYDAPICSVTGGVLTDLRQYLGQPQRFTAVQINGKVTEYSGSGTPQGVIAGKAGDQYKRDDTPATANQRIYVCTVTGLTPATTTWVGIL